jgi:hypothetical protein
MIVGGTMHATALSACASEDIPTQRSTLGVMANAATLAILCLRVAALYSRNKFSNQRSSGHCYYHQTLRCVPS